MPLPPSKRTEKLSQVADALEEIKKNPALSAVLVELRKVFANDGFDASYDLGVRAHGLRKEFGTVALRQLAWKLRVEVAVVHEAARVAAAFSPEDVKKIRARKNPSGFPLSFDHLVVLSRRKLAGQRAELIDRAIDEGLSVSELKLEARLIPPESLDPEATQMRHLRFLDSFLRCVDRELPYILAAVKADEPGARDAVRQLQGLMTGIADKIERLIVDADKAAVN